MEQSVYEAKAIQRHLRKALEKFDWLLTLYVGKVLM